MFSAFTLYEGQKITYQVEIHIAHSYVKILFCTAYIYDGRKITKKCIHFVYEANLHSISFFAGNTFVYISFATFPPKRQYTLSHAHRTYVFFAWWAPLPN